MTAFTPECRAFLLEKARTGKLGTVRADGRPHVTPVWFDVDGDTIVFTTWHTSVKGVNIQRDARVCICVDDETPPFSFVIIEGNATMAPDPEHLQHWATRISGRYMGVERAEEYGKRNGIAGELLVRVTPTKIIFQRNVAD
jgi:PPOX class probable F420-dependent enzyme